MCSLHHFWKSNGTRQDISPVDLKRGFQGWCLENTSRDQERVFPQISAHSSLRSQNSRILALHEVHTKASDSENGKASIIGRIHRKALQFPTKSLFGLQ